MKMNVGSRILVVAALAFALGSTGCRSGWKMGNPFARAPKAAASDAPSELDELDDLTPPPENYTSNDDSRSKKDRDDESLAQRGEYDAPKKPAPEKSALEKKSAPDAALASVEIAPNDAPAPDARLLANAAAAKETLPANENYQTPSYGQSYQATSNYDVALNAPPVATPQAPLSQAPAPQAAYPQTSYSQAAPQTVASTAQASPFPTSPALSPFPAVEPIVAPGSVANAAPIALAQSAAVPAAEPGLVDYSTLNVAAQTAPAAQIPTSTAPAAPTAPAYVAQNFPDAPASAYQAAPTVSSPFPTSDAFVPAATSPSASVSQSDPNGGASDAYSNVYYQQQTTSGGFAPGSVGVY